MVYFTEHTQCRTDIEAEIKILGQQGSSLDSDFDL